MPKSIFFPGRGEGFETESVTDTRATTDKNDPFLNMGFKHGKKWVDKNGAKCNLGFGRTTKNTPRRKITVFVTRHFKPDVFAQLIFQGKTSRRRTSQPLLIAADHFSVREPPDDAGLPHTAGHHCHEPRWHRSPMDTTH